MTATLTIKYNDSNNDNNNKLSAFYEIKMNYQHLFWIGQQKHSSRLVELYGIRDSAENVYISEMLHDSNTKPQKRVPKGTFEEGFIKQNCA